jgi:competence protein ComEC
MPTRMTFEFLDVGMGDSSLVIMGNTAATQELALIDLGVQPFTKFKIGVDDAMAYLANAIATVSKARGLADPYIDHLFITHPDQDHYNRILTLIEDVPFKGYGVKNLSIGKLTYGGRKSLYGGNLINKIGAYVVDKGYKDLTTKQHSTVNNDGSVTPNWTFVNNDISVYLLNVNYPTVGSDDPNPLSLCLMFEDQNENKMIFLGDAEADVEKQIIKNFKDAKKGFLFANCLKLGHHGSLAGTSQKWIDAVKPDAIVASGDFVWAHPYCPTIKRVIDSNVLKTMTKHRYCCGVSDKEYFNNNQNLRICFNLWYVVKQAAGEQMVDEVTKKVALAAQGLTYGVQWEISFSGNSAPSFARTDTSVPQ